jgi:hypothetical protein
MNSGGLASCFGELLPSARIVSGRWGLGSRESRCSARNIQVSDASLCSCVLSPFDHNSSEVIIHSSVIELLSTTGAFSLHSKLLSHNERHVSVYSCVQSTQRIREAKIFDVKAIAWILPPWKVTPEAKRAMNTC